MQFDDATAMDAATFQHHVAQSYHTLFRSLGAGRARHPVRFWNFIPAINQDLGGGLDRYMAFNSGRHEAFVAHFGEPATFSRCLPTASGVGTDGDQFVVHALAADEPGIPVDNLRQVPAYRYSSRFGPMPPSFARATLLGRATTRPLLIVGGTASIIGEESRHGGVLEQQAAETLRNLASIVEAAFAHTRAHNDDEIMSDRLSAFRDVRVYHRRPDDRAAVAALVRPRFPASCRIEIVTAALCRPELLIEIEGIATTQAGTHSASVGLEDH